MRRRAVPLRWRVTAAFAGVLALVLLALGAFVLWRMSSALDQSLDRSLQVRAGEVAALVDQPGLALFPPGGPTLEADENVAQILAPDGTVLAASSFAGLALVDLPRLQAASAGPVRWDRPGDAALDEDLRLLARPVVGSGETYVVVVGSSLDERNETLTTLLVTGLAGLPVALVAAVAAGYATAGLALRPVRAALERERRFVAEASHQLRTPLALITTEVELAALGPSDPATHAAALRSIGEEATRMTRLSDQLLLLAAQDERRLLGPREPVAVAELLAGVADRHRRAAAVSGRAIEVAAFRAGPGGVRRPRPAGGRAGQPGGERPAPRHRRHRDQRRGRCRSGAARCPRPGRRVRVPDLHAVPPRAGLDRQRSGPGHRAGGS